MARVGGAAAVTGRQGCKPVASSQAQILVQRLKLLSATLSKVSHAEVSKLEPACHAVFVKTHSENTLRHYLADAAINNPPLRQHADS